MERKLAAILSADVVAFSRLMEQDESGTFMRLRSCRKELFEPQIAKHRGRIFKLMGDGLLAEFASVVDAVECAVLLQRLMAKRNAAFPADRRLEIRMGINLGDVIIEDDDRYGEGVNIASRLQQLAKPGGICVSGTVYEHVKHKLALAFEESGEHKVKNIAEPILVYRILLGRVAPPRRHALARGRWRASRLVQIGASAAALVVCVLGLLALIPRMGLFRSEPGPPAAATASSLPTIAVLPFVNMSSDRELDYLADGITTAIISDLTRSGLFRVPSRNLPRASGQALDVRQLGRELGAQFVLGGSVHKGASRLRAAAQLIDTRTGDHVWGGRYDGPPGDILAFQDKASAEITGLLARTADLASGRKAVASGQSSAPSTAAPPSGAVQPVLAPIAAAEPAQTQARSATGPAAQTANLSVQSPTGRPGPARSAIDPALVVLIQDRLRKLGYDPGPVDGYVGQRTRAVISMYQAEQGLRVDGVPSQALLEHLQRHAITQTKAAEVPAPHSLPTLPAPASPAPLPTASVLAPQPEPPASAVQSGAAQPAQAVRMADPSLVFLIQHRLRELGFMPSRFDGRMDAGTANAIRAYQKSRWLPTSGTASRQLLERLEKDVASLAASARPAQPPAANVRASIACADAEGNAGECEAVRGQVIPAPSLGAPPGASPTGN